MKCQLATGSKTSGLLSGVCERCYAQERRASTATPASPRVPPHAPREERPAEDQAHVAQETATLRAKLQAADERAARAEAQVAELRRNAEAPSIKDF